MKDPYCDGNYAFERLKREYNSHKRLIVAVDFDDTIFDYHGAGHTYDGVINLLKRCQDLNFHIVIFTASKTEKYPFIRTYCEKLGLNVKFINENAVDMDIGKNGKIYYNILLDDRAGLGQACVVLENVVEYAEIFGNVVEYSGNQ